MEKTKKNKMIKRRVFSVKENTNHGQALLVLLFFAIIGITIISAAAIMLYANTSSLTTSQEGSYAYYIAQSGVQEALIRIIRNPNYSGGTLSVGSGTATIQVVGGVITSTGSINNVVRKIQVQTFTDQYGTSITSWKEIN